MEIGYSADNITRRAIDPYGVEGLVRPDALTGRVSGGRPRRYTSPLR